VEINAGGIGSWKLVLGEDDAHVVDFLERVRATLPAGLSGLRLSSMARGGGRDENTNWRLRDNYTYYWDQVKAAPGAAREVLKIPGAWASGVREMVAEMRDDPGRQPAEHPEAEQHGADGPDS
jgi:hypothetical protein